MWVKFTKDYRFKPKPTVTTAYKAGMVANLPKATAERVVADGLAEAIPDDNKPKRSAQK